MTENVDLSKQFKNTVKIGYGYQVRNRDFLARKLNLAKYSQLGGGGIVFEDSLVNLSDEQIFNEKNIGLLANGKGGFLLEQIINPYDAYDASSSIFSRYIMIDSRYKQRSRLVWGVRLETFVQKLNSTRDDRSPVNLNTTTSDYLPSLNYVYSISENQNLRLSYSNTVNRPEFRELAPFVFYDFGNRYTYSGNDSLVRCKVYNYDLRYELFPGRNQILSTSLFYKKFINPIEQKANPNYVREVTYINANSAICYGAELEFRFILGALSKKETSILNDFTVSCAKSVYNFCRLPK
jgi:outer membrane receptor protein involved in Fe transport